MLNFCLLAQSDTVCTLYVGILSPFKLMIDNTLDIFGSFNKMLAVGTLLDVTKHFLDTCAAFV